MFFFTTNHLSWFNSMKIFLELVLLDELFKLSIIVSTTITLNGNKFRDTAIVKCKISILWHYESFCLNIKDTRFSLCLLRGKSVKRTSFSKFFHFDVLRVSRHIRVRVQKHTFIKFRLQIASLQSRWKGPRVWTNLFI